MPAGLARRVLVVAPSHLTVQWLVELFHKFNHLFTFMDGERYEKSLEELPYWMPAVRPDTVFMRGADLALQVMEAE